MAFVDFIGIICDSQWVVCTDPLTLCVLASGWLAQFRLVSFSFISFTDSASAWLMQTPLGLFVFVNNFEAYTVIEIALIFCVPIYSTT